MVIVKQVDRDVSAKINTQYVEARLPALPKTRLVYVCRSEGSDEPVWTDEDGTQYITIRLPYAEVRVCGDVRELMLNKAKARLARLILCPASVSPG
jgi:hypothetical protein